MADDDKEIDDDTDVDTDGGADSNVPGVAAGQVAKTGGPLDFDDLPEPDYAGLYAIDELQVDGDNPNEMNDKTFGLLVDRMRKNGWLGGPIITNTEGIIADGEHRWRAAKDIGLTEVPVRMYDIDEATRRLWREELNKIHGEHDSQRDALEYDFLVEHGKRDEVLELTDARGEDLDELLRSLQVERSRPVHVDYGDDPNVHYMDCVQGMVDHLDDNSVDMVFTSPPYNVGLGEGTRSTWIGDPDKHDDDRVFYEDDQSWEEYLDFLGDVFEQFKRVVRPSGSIFFNIQVDTRGGTIKPPTWVADLSPVPWRSYIVWSKGVMPPGAAGMQVKGRFAQTWEPILHFSEDPSPLHGTRNFAVWEVRPSNFEHDEDTGPHPAPFPVELVKRAINATTTEGDLILDPFLGSGTTAVAAIETERDYIGFELDQQGAYKPIIERRIKDAHRRMATASTREEAAAMREKNAAEAGGGD